MLWLLGYLLGCFAVLLGHWPSAALTVCLFVPPMLLLACLSPRAIRFALLAFLLGMCWSFLLSNQYQRSLLPESLNDQWVSVQGQVISDPIRYPDHIWLKVKLYRYRTETQWHEQSFIATLSWYHTEENIQTGDRFEWVVHLKRPHAYHDPGVRDKRLDYLANRISATGYVRYGKRLSHRQIYPFEHSLTELRQTIAGKLRSILPPSPARAILLALSTGDRSEISPETYQLLQDTSTSHLIAIAGVHLGFIAWLFYGIGNLFWRMSTRLCRRFPAQQAGIISACFGAFGYAALCGFRLPALRALLMLVIAALAKLRYRQLSFLSLLLVAAGVLLLWDPFVILTESFWLSFSAVAIIFAFVDRGKWELLKLQYALTIGLLPLSFLFFHQASFSGLIANLIAVPMLGFVILPVLVGTIVTLSTHIGTFLLLCVYHATSDLLTALQTLDHIFPAHFYYTPQSAWVVAAMIVSTLLFLAPRGLAFKPFAVILLIFLLTLPNRYAVKPGEMRLVVMDVGQGLACLVMTAHHTLVYDTGPRFPSGFDLGSYVVVPVMRYFHIHHLNRLVISHGDMDHRGGMESVMAAFPPDRLLSSAPFIYDLPRAMPCHAGQEWEWDGVQFSMLSPPLHQPYLGNNSSCVLHVSDQTQSVLLTGDIEASTESALIAQHASLHATILVAPHHGSHTSSTDAFIHAVSPKIVIFSTGYLNRFHFPSRDVVARYQAAKVRMWNTARKGVFMWHLKL